jgi:hypothetical protein
MHAVMHAFLKRTLGHPPAVALRFVRCDQLTAGLAPARMRPAGRTKEKGLRFYP